MSSKRMIQQQVEREEKCNVRDIGQRVSERVNKPSTHQSSQSAKDCSSHSG